MISEVESLRTEVDELRQNNNKLTKKNMDDAE